MHEWASDVNAICAREATRVSSAFEKMRSAGADIVQISKPYQEKPPNSIAEFTAAIDEPMSRAFDASMVVDSSYGNTLRQINHVNLPDLGSDRENATSWIQDYERLDDSFHDVYQTLANYTTSNNADEQIGFFQDFIPQMGIYNKSVEDTFNNGKEIGVKSCI